MFFNPFNGASGDAAVDGHVVDPLLGLMLDHVQEVLGFHVLNIAAQLFEHLVDRNRPNRNRALFDDLGADFVDVLSGGKIHHGVGPIVDRRVQLFQLAFHRP